MRHFILGILLALGLAIPACGQTRLLIGADGGYSADNTFIGPEVRAEIPVPHFEFAVMGSYLPLNYHNSIGFGRAWGSEGRVTGWVNHTSGFTGTYSHGGYVAHGKYTANKTNDYITAGYVYKHTMLGFPTRFYFEFLDEVRNGISSNGTESSQTKGFVFTFDTREWCGKHGCIRQNFKQWGGRVLTQGNPQCDGTFVNTVGYTCPRGKAAAGGFEWKVSYEIGGGKKNDRDLY